MIKCSNCKGRVGGYRYRHIGKDLLTKPDGTAIFTVTEHFTSRCLDCHRMIKVTNAKIILRVFVDSEGNFIIEE